MCIPNSCTSCRVYIVCVCVKKRTKKLQFMKKIKLNRYPLKLMQTKKRHCPPPHTDVDRLGNVEGVYFIAGIGIDGRKILFRFWDLIGYNSVYPPDYDLRTCNSWRLLYIYRDKNAIK